MHTPFSELLLNKWPLLIKNEADIKLLEKECPWLLHRDASRVRQFGHKIDLQLIEDYCPDRKPHPYEDRALPPLAFAVLAKNVVPGIVRFEIPRPEGVDVTEWAPYVEILLHRDNGGVVHCWYGTPLSEGTPEQERSNFIVYKQQRESRKLLGFLDWPTKAEMLRCYSKDDSWFCQTFSANLEILLDDYIDEMGNIKFEIPELHEQVR